MDSSSGSSSRPSNKTDPGWKYNILVDPKNSYKITCIFCGKVTCGGISRAKYHQIGGNRNAKKCLKCPDDVAKELSDFMEKKADDKINYDKVPDIEDLDEMEDEDVGELEVNTLGKRAGQFNKAKSTSLPAPKKVKGKGPMDSFTFKKPEMVVELRKQGRLKQTKIYEKLDKERRDNVVQYIAKFFYEGGIPFNVARLKSFHCIIEAIGQYGAGMRPPSYHEIRVKCLKKEVANMNDIINQHRAVWVKYGCSLMADGWTSTTGKSIVNFLVSSLEGCVFIKSVDASSYSKTGERVQKLLDEFVEYVGESNVVQVVTDNGSNFKLGGKMLEIKRPNLYWTPCAAHCIDLMLEDIGKMPLIKKTLDNAVSLTGYIYNSTGVLHLMRKFTNQANLVRAGKTRFATCYLNLKSIHQHKNTLRGMFISEDWTSSKWAKEAKGKRAAETVFTVSFWNNIVYILMLMGPLVKVLRIVDNEKKPVMGYIYEAMDRAKEAISKSFNGRKKKYEEAFTIIDNRWEVQLHHPLHVAGHFLNPEFFYEDPTIEFNEEITKGLYECITKLTPNQELQPKIMDELAMYTKAGGLFGFSLAIKTRKTKAPADWWRLYGNSAPNLQKLAIRILSLSCSASGCERNWSVFEQIHTKRRNKLGMQKLNDLVFVKYNRAIKERYDSMDAMDPIALTDIDDCNEWLVGEFGQNPTGEEDASNDLVFSDDDVVGGLRWGAVNAASGAGESSRSTRANTKTSHKNPRPSVGSSKGFTLRDEDESEEDIEGYNSDENGVETNDDFGDDNSSNGDTEGDGDV